jgi:hypothetical protein
MEMKFWAVLGRQGCREKEIPKCNFFEYFFQLFVGKASALKSYII